MNLFPVDWDWSNFNLTKEQFDEAWAEIHSTNNFWEKLKIRQGVSLDSLDQLFPSELYYITSREETVGDPAQVQTAKWLKKNLGELVPSVIISFNKGEVAKALKLDAFVDDNINNCLKVLEAVPTCKVFIMDGSHNKGFNHPQIKRVYSFDEFVNTIVDTENESEC